MQGNRVENFDFSGKNDNHSLLNSPPDAIIVLARLFTYS